jgi:hypothetical protein
MLFRSWTAVVSTLAPRRERSKSEQQYALWTLSFSYSYSLLSKSHHTHNLAGLGGMEWSVPMEFTGEECKHAMAI